MAQKPLQLTHKEFVESIEKLLNGSPLPAFVKIGVLNDAIQSLSEIAAQEYDNAERYWEKEEVEAKKRAEEKKEEGHER